MEGQTGTHEEHHRLVDKNSGMSLLTQNQDLFVKYLEPLFLNYLKDRVFSIRAAAI